MCDLCDGKGKTRRTDAAGLEVHVCRACDWRNEREHGGKVAPFENDAGDEFCCPFKAGETTDPEYACAACATEANQRGHDHEKEDR